VDRLVLLIIGSSRKTQVGMRVVDGPEFCDAMGSL